MGRRSEFIVVEGKAYHIGLAAGQLARRLLLVGDPARALLVAERFDHIEGEYRHREYVTVTGRFRGQRVSVMGTGIGTDNVEIALMESAALWDFDLATGQRHPDQSPRPLVVRVGTSGGAQPDVAAGTQVIAAYAIGLDSTGLYFDGPAADDVVLALEDQATLALARAASPGARFARRLPVYAAKASPALTTTLARLAAARGLPCAVGVTVAAPGFYGASSRWVDGVTNTVADVKGALAAIAVGDQRVLNFEMESSLLFHLAAQLDVHAATVCPVISQPQSHGEVFDYRPAVAAAIELGLSALVEDAV